jgi:selenide,water dikinase
MTQPIRLTQYSHGAGCGCKIAPGVLETILHSGLDLDPDPKLLVGHGSNDDAAVYDLGNGTAVISTTDFFMPIVDDPFDFGRIAATNAMSDIYAMGGRPLMAIAVLGWPINQLPAEVAREVVEGGRRACADAGMRLAGGHSIDSPEPIFGTAVTGLLETRHLKRNNTAEPGCHLYLTKPLGIGILTTAEKQQKLKQEHRGLATEVMCQINIAGEHFGAIEGVTAMTDVTGFGLMGHLLEMCEGSGVHARLEMGRIPLLPDLVDYVDAGCVPGGSGRNFDSYGQRLGPLSETQRAILCDPQTSGGLLAAVRPESEEEFLRVAHGLQLDLKPIGQTLVPAAGTAAVHISA